MQRTLKKGGKSHVAIHRPRVGKYTYTVGKSSAGFGLFAGENIKRGDFVIEYYGPILTPEEADTKKGKYLFEVNSRKVVDGTPRYNMARYINHSCRPNCETDIVRGKIYIYARRNIKDGEELSYDYGKEYFNDFIKPYGCKCPKCCGK